MLKPGATVGILGGGQLARMLALAAAPLGLRCHIYAPAGDNPAFEVAGRSTAAAYGDEAALAAFADAVDVVTYEFENVPARTAAVLEARVPVLPGPRALETTQDRLLEKSFVRDLGIPVAPFLPVDDLDMLEEGVATLGRPCVLKTRRMGYDGKGQVIIRAGTDLPEAWGLVGMQPSILEGFVPFLREVSVVGARGRDGSFSAYDLCENEHRDHILALTQVPALASREAKREALGIAERIAGALDYVGVLAVEMFLVEQDGRERVLVNEIAPRVHNSGHWTIEGADCSQFEQHLRAIAGWPLGSTARRGRIEMENLVGSEMDRWPRILLEPGTHLHLYGKAESRPGRKMGHVTRVFEE
jgi:5-(carboxyamino)imidazole ribonucleotide synthase